MSRGAVVEHNVFFTHDGKEHTAIIEIELGGDELAQLIADAICEHFKSEGYSDDDATKMADKAEWVI